MLRVVPSVSSGEYHVQMTLTYALSILLTEDFVVANGGSLCVHGFTNLRVLSASSGAESRLAGGSSVTL